MKLQLPADVEWILRLLEENGYDTYLVGGAVRDLVRGVVPKDYDFATSATPEETLLVFKEYRSFTQGARFGTIGVVLHNHHYEITTFRKDQTYLDSRRPENVVFSKDIKEDLMRRDFTINALAYHPDKGILDYFEGQKDINIKKVRAVGDATERFKEDALRILRAIRFAITLDFEIDFSTKEAMNALLHTIQFVAIERVHDEIVKCFYHFETIEETFITVLELYFPILRKCTKEMWAKNIELFKVLPPKEAYYYTFLFKDAAVEEFVPLLKNFKVSAQVIQDVKIFTKYLQVPFVNDSYTIKTHLNKIKKDQFLSILFLKRMELWSNHTSLQELEKVILITETILKNKEPYLLKHVAITGNTLITHGIPEGKKMKSVLEYLLDLVMKDPALNKEDILLQYARDYMATYL